MSKVTATDATDTVEISTIDHSEAQKAGTASGPEHSTITIQPLAHQAITDSQAPEITLNIENSGFCFKGGLMPMTMLELKAYDYKTFNARLAKMAKQAPSFFKQMPVVVSLEKLENDHKTIDFIELTEVCNAYSILPIAFKGGNEAQQTAALVAGYVNIPSNASHKDFHRQFAEKYGSPASDSFDISHKAKGAKETPEPPTIRLDSEIVTPNNEALVAQAKADSTENRPTKVIHHTIRSGQQIYAEGCDLIIVGAVSAGAEILADGNIHVYGTLRGRALAGINGNDKARIFCQKLEAELLSISGRYKMDEDLQGSWWKQAAQARLEGNRLVLSGLSELL